MTTCTFIDSGLGARCASRIATYLETKRKSHQMILIRKGLQKPSIKTCAKLQLVHSPGRNPVHPVQPTAQLSLVKETLSITLL